MKLLSVPNGLSGAVRIVYDCPHFLFMCVALVLTKDDVPLDWKNICTTCAAAILKNKDIGRVFKIVNIPVHDPTELQFSADAQKLNETGYGCLDCHPFPAAHV